MDTYKKTSTKLIVTLFCVSNIAHAQPSKITYYQNIEPIIVKNCVTCHRNNESAPFPLLTYNDVAKRAEFIGYVTQTRYMPPWQADPEFQHYANERLLSAEDIKMIQDWVANGALKGKKTARENKEVVIKNDTDTPDLILKIDPYPIETNNKDDFRFFNLPTNQNQDQYVRKIEFIPGNKRLVHHSRLMLDTTHQVRAINRLSANDPRISDFEKYPPVDKFFHGWVPGNYSTEFPNGTAKKLFANSDIILNVHYSPNSKLDQTDQSIIKLYFNHNSTQNEVYSLAIAEENITNKPFIIPANEKKIFYSKFGPLPVDIYALAVLPHMHNLGKSIRAFAITPEGDAIMLVKINNWNFKWQETYWFKEQLKIPRGSVIFIEAEFDNTQDNPANPSNPPIDATYGWNTTNEMLEMIIYYLLK